MRVVSCLAVVGLLAGGCQSPKESMKNTTAKTVNQDLDFSAGPPTIVYKTKQDYTNKVAVILTPDKTEIASYPHPQDIAKRGNKVQPLLLADGYLLDNQGINQNVAFTSYTFEQYAALPQTPSMEELKSRIIDKEPLQFMCHCGNRNQFTSLEATMNDLIAQKLAPCKPLH
ncbi:hypothetical protein AHMF7605_02935 [Adhaeribacter arboris]|uniref:Uncharacterized protein n=1 Tax=Adhaeribacter arboris TaxID=2072846 RepID=A0A2T2YAM9_9BACT|nr:hypothetical protein [Adhaeribacter arboris]PSR52553.1 hypothetical protein AHMF7605_02935 [Adhaeribacter arboris]